MKYYDFDLWIDKKPAGAAGPYPARAWSRMGQVTDGTLNLDPASAAIRDLLEQLDAGHADADACKLFGKTLFAALFEGRVGRLLQESLGNVRSRDKVGLRIRLRIEPPEVAALPWELLYDEDEDCFLSTSVETPLLRYLELPTMMRELATSLPVRVLLVIPDNPELDAKDEEARIVRSFSELNQTALEECGRPAIEYKTLNGVVTADTINRALNGGEYHIFHFIGHGTLRDGEGHLLLTPRDGEDGLISAEDFAYFFMDVPSIKLVFLNACKSATATPARLMTGVAHQVVKRKVPAVVAMSYWVTDQAAKLFADDFYQNLCIGVEPGRVDSATAHARKWVLQNVGHTSDFFAPVLIMRSSNGVIFDTRLPAAAGDAIDEVHRIKDAQATRHDTIKMLGAAEAKATSPETKDEAARALEQERRELGDARRRLRAIYAQVAAAALPQFLAVILGVSVVVYFAYHTKFFNILHLDDLWQRNFVSHMGGYVANPINDAVRVVLIDEADNGGLGNYAQDKNDPARAGEWRKRHGELIAGLVAAGARVVAFDLIFGMKTTDEANQQLCEAISRAEVGGKTRVLAGMGWDDGKISSTGGLTPALAACLKENWGNVDVGQQRWGLVDEYELAHKSTEAGTPPLIPSLALQAVAGYDRRQADLKPSYDEAAGLIRLPTLPPREIPVIARGGDLHIIIGYADDADLGKVKRDYVNVYRGLKASDPVVLSDFQGRVVLVGSASKDDRHNVLGGSQPRYGVHMHANVVSNILNGFYVHYLSTSMNLLAIAAMAAVGFLLQTRFRAWMRPKVKLPFLNNTEITVPVLLLVVVGAYLVIAFVAFQQSHVIFDVSYHLGALAFSYAVVGILRRKLGLR